MEYSVESLIDEEVVGSKVCGAGCAVATFDMEERIVVGAVLEVDWTPNRQVTCAQK